MDCIYDSDIVLSNIVYTVEDQPLQDGRPLESKSEPELETSSECDAKSTIDNRLFHYTPAY